MSGSLGLDAIALTEPRLGYQINTSDWLAQDSTCARWRMSLALFEHRCFSQCPPKFMLRSMLILSRSCCIDLRTARCLRAYWTMFNDRFAPKAVACTPFLRVCVSAGQ